MNNVEINRFIKRLSNYRGKLPAQLLKTLRGQALAGDLIGAKKGLQNLCIAEQNRSI